MRRRKEDFSRRSQAHQVEAVQELCRRIDEFFKHTFPEAFPASNRRQPDEGPPPREGQPDPDAFPAAGRKRHLPIQDPKVYGENVIMWVPTCSEDFFKVANLADTLELERSKDGDEVVYNFRRRLAIGMNDHLDPQARITADDYFRSTDARVALLSPESLKSVFSRGKRLDDRETKRKERVLGTPRLGPRQDSEVELVEEFAGKRLKRSDSVSGNRASRKRSAEPGVPATSAAGAAASVPLQPASRAAASANVSVAPSHSPTTAVAVSASVATASSVAPGPAPGPPSKPAASGPSAKPAASGSPPRSAASGPPTKPAVPASVAPLPISPPRPPPVVIRLSTPSTNVDSRGVGDPGAGAGTSNNNDADLRQPPRHDSKVRIKPLATPTGSDTRVAEVSAGGATSPSNNDLDLRRPPRSVSKTKKDGQGRKPSSSASGKQEERQVDSPSRFAIANYVARAGAKAGLGKKAAAAIIRRSFRNSKDRQVAEATSSRRSGGHRSPSSKEKAARESCTKPRASETVDKSKAKVQGSKQRPKERGDNSKTKAVEQVSPTRSEPRQGGHPSWRPPVSSGEGSEGSDVAEQPRLKSEVHTVTSPPTPAHSDEQGPSEDIYAVAANLGDFEIEGAPNQDIWMEDGVDINLTKSESNFR